MREPAISYQRPAATELRSPLGVPLGAAAVTVTATERVAEPPLPEQVRPKFELADRGPTLCEPETALVPDQAPLAVQPVELVALQFNVTLLPLVTAAELELKVTTGAGATDTVAEPDCVPPGPVQLNV